MYEMIKAEGFWMFPARAGMNREGFAPAINHEHVPRTRGDEPLQEEAEIDMMECSPHARG